MNLKKLNEKSSDLLDNIKFISKHTDNNKQGDPRLFKEPNNLNYQNKYQIEIEEVETNEKFEALNLMTQYIKANHTQRPNEVNYFLDDTPLDKINIENDQKIPKKYPCMAICLRNTWSKGYQFFFIDQGQVIKIWSVNNGYATIELESKKGVIHINDLQLH